MIACAGSGFMTTSTALRPLAWAPSSLGVICGALLLEESLRPSLLPRTLMTQIALSSLAVVTGYAVGAAIGAIGRLLVRHLTGRAKPPRGMRVIGRAGAVTAVAAAVARAPVLLQLQAEQRAALGLPVMVPNSVLVLGGATAGGVLMVLLGRGLRTAARRLGRPLIVRRQWSPRHAAIAGGLVEAFICLAIIAGGLAVLRPVFATRDRRIAADEHPPTSALRSAGPGSRVDWATLGVQGRRFVTGGPSTRDIGHVRQSAIRQRPIRVYVGLLSAPTPATRTELALRELERTGAFWRSAIVVATPAGTGFVNPLAIDPVEVMFGGDVASVSMQYSVLPSFLSFALDGAASANAGRQLLDAVLSRTRSMAADDRPAVFVYGESLGAYGSQAAFVGRGMAGLQRVSGALWIGPTAASGFRSELLAGVTDGPARAPIIGDGGVVRFANDAAGLRGSRATWGPVRAAYLQHATDPVVWFSPSLAWSQPRWLREAPGPGVPSHMVWRPLLTFEQVLMDLPMATSIAPGYGHDYDADVPLAWLEIVRPPGWHQGDTERMLQLLDQ
jgi:uncharacterized membrane protein